ncbi:12309_t:CDS:2 [Acaulospora morrowiae]|uniref:12309_t:CDS:1 n=1 Tax=Acaulospora morrowiae TaxID=94023 RepID=A0A9N8VCE5_9GLOM|nr:12309_t:CDS:2 [Acaulospora morrowiae]
MSSATEIIIGLRIGQSYSSIAIINKDKRVDCIANEDGERQIPTMVAFSGDEELTGTQAKVQLLSNSKNTVMQFRNFIGKSFADCKSEVSRGAAQLIDKDGEPAYSVEFKEQETIFTVKEITTKYIASLRESAENFLGQPVAGSVLAIPTYFDDSQREALRAATENAGLRVLQLINEPTAAALSYEIGQQPTSPNRYHDSTIVILDLGSDSFDVTAMSIRSGMFTILGTKHDANLGGFAFDELLANHFASEFKRKTKIDVLQNKRAMVKLRSAVEAAKKTLSSNSTAPCSIESLAEGVDFHGTINRTRFEIMANRLFNRISEIIIEVLKSNELESQLINEVILVGGASRIPKFQSKIREIFTNPDTVIRQELEPDEIVAYGCALQCSLIADLNVREISENFDTTVTSTPHLSKPIGTVNAREKFVTIIPENTPLPVRRMYTFSNVSDDQKEIYFSIWEGAYKSTSMNSEESQVVNDDEPNNEDSPSPLAPIIEPEKLLAELVMNNLPPKKSGELKIEFTIEIDVSSKCTIIAKESTIDNAIKLTIDGNS